MHLDGAKLKGQNMCSPSIPHNNNIQALYEHIMIIPKVLSNIDNIRYILYTS